MKKTGLIVAVEMFAVFEKWGEPDAKYEGLPFKSCSYERGGGTIYVVRSGPGQEAARAAAAMAIDEFGVTELWNFGVVGSLVPELKIGDVYVVQDTVRWDVSKEQAVLYKIDDPFFGGDFDKCISLLNDATANADTKEQLIELPQIRVFKGRCASGDSVVAEKTQRIAVAERTGGHIVDMESCGIAKTAAARGVPCYMIKCVSDDLCTVVQELTDAFRPTAQRAFEAFSCIYENVSIIEKS